MVGWRAGLIALALGVATLAAADDAAVGESADPRLARADALLGDASGYPEAIELYRELLAEDPEAPALRLRLARVLAWSRHYVDSLAEYERLIAGPDTPPSARIERAEVLSWAGRLREAEREFRALLDDDPSDARAARGLARTQRWAGRLAQAEESYERALEVEADPEAEQEYALLRAGRLTWIRPGVAYVNDSDDYSRLESELESAFYRGPLTTLRAHAGFQRVAHSQDDVPRALRSGHSSDRASVLGLGFERRFESERLSRAARFDLETGVRLWQHADEMPYARARFELPLWRAALGLEGHSAGLLDESASFEALQERLRANGGGVSLWTPLGRGFEFYGSYGLAWIDDGNRRQRAGAAISLRPFRERRTSIGVEGSWLRYADRSAFYYDPSSDVGLGLRVRDELELVPNLHFHPSAGIGLGRSNDGGSVSGVTFDVSGEIGYLRAPWRIALQGARSQSQRADSYARNQVMLRITRELGAR